MKYLKIILFSFLIGSVVSVAEVMILRSQEAVTRPPRACDMGALAYPLSIGLNLFLALATLPALFNRYPKVRENTWLSAISFFILPLAVTVYSVATLDLSALIFCLPYLVPLLYFFIRFRYSLRS